MMRKSSVTRIAAAAGAFLCIALLTACHSPSSSTTISSRLTSSDASFTDGNGDTHYARAYSCKANKDGVASVSASSTDFIPIVGALLGDVTDPNSAAAPGFDITSNANASTVTATFIVSKDNAYTVLLFDLDPQGTGNFSITFSPELGSINQAGRSVQAARASGTTGQTVNELPAGAATIVRNQLKSRR
jgi:hypothetical protein